MIHSHWNALLSIVLLVLAGLAAPGDAYCQSVPRILTNGIVNAAGAPLPPAPVAPGLIISIFGFNFNSSSGTHAGGVSATPPLPTSIGGTQVLINSRFAPLYYVDSTQINAQVPWEVSGASYITVQVIVNGLPSNLSTVALAENAPGMLVVTHALDGSLVSPSQPATPGEYLTIYVVGLGSVANPPATGAAALAKPLSTTTLMPALTIGGVAANVIFSGLTPGFSGLYQVNAQVPQGTTHGDDVSVVLSVGGAISNTLATSVQSDMPSAVRVSISPTSVSMFTGTTQQFTAAVSGDANPAVTWSVNGILDENSTIGTISSSGLYAAPATIPSGTIAFVAATSTADPTVAGTATVALSAPAPAASPLGRFRSSGPGVWAQFDYRGVTGGYYTGQVLHLWNAINPAVGDSGQQEVSLQLDKMRGMGLTAITFVVRTSKAVDKPGDPFVPPECSENPDLGLNWPQPTADELTNLKALFDLAQSKGIKIRLGLVNTHMEEQPPVNNTLWLGAIFDAIGNHPSLDVITLDGTPLLVPSTPNGPPDKCGVPAEAALWEGPGTIQTQYITWAIGYGLSRGVSARKLSAEAIIGDYYTEARQPKTAAFTLKYILDQVGIPNNQRTYALSFYEHRKCSDAGSLPCTDLDPHSWAEQSLQNVYAIVGNDNGARLVATENGGNLPPVDRSFRTEWALESLVTLLEKYQIDGGSFFQWVQMTYQDESNPTLDDAVKRRGVNFVYNPVQKEVLDWAGFHLTAIPNGSFEEDLNSNGVPTHWAVTGKGSASACYLPQESGQPQVPSRGSYCLRLTSSDGTAAISATSDRIAVTPGTNYTTAANLRFTWSGDPNPSGTPSTRPQVFVTIHYLNASGKPASIPSTVFPYFQENATQGFQTFIFQYTTPSDAQSVQIELGAARNGLAAPIIFDVDNLR